MRRVLATGSAALVLAACGADGEREPPAAAGPQRYAADATVLEEDDRSGPMLCVGIVLESLPPQCGDVPLDGWDWDAVEGEQRMSGTTWGDYRVIGTYDGERFAVEEVLPPTPPSSGEEDIDPVPTPCEEPAGGWLAQLPGEGSRDLAIRYAEAQPEHVDTWVTWLEPEADPAENDSYLVNVVFTERAAEHESAMRDRWSGPICVLEREGPTARDREQMQAEVERMLDDLGVRWTGVGSGGAGRPIGVEVLADPGGELQALLDERFGPGIVVVTQLLEPVD